MQGVLQDVHTASTCLTTVSWLGYAAVESPIFLSYGQDITQLTKLLFGGQAPGFAFGVPFAVQPAIALVHHIADVC